MVVYLTPQTFEHFMWRTMIIRLVEEEKPKEGFTEAHRLTTLLVYSSVADEHTNIFRTGLKYTWTTPSRDFGDAVGLVDISLDPNEHERRNQIQSLLADWKNSVPLWLQEKTLVAVRKTAGGRCSELPPHSLMLVHHLIRMQTRVAYETVISEVDIPTKRSEIPLGVHSGWVLSSFYYALGRIIEHQLDAREQ